MARRIRTAYLIVAWLFVVVILIQVFLAGFALFALFEDQPALWDIHGVFGYSAVHGVAIVLLVLAFLSRLPRPTLVLTIVAVALAFVQPGFAARGTPLVGALHPLLALIFFGMAVTIALKARSLAPPPLGTARAEELPAARGS